jgi:hypothetical protein
VRIGFLDDYAENAIRRLSAARPPPEAAIVEAMLTRRHHTDAICSSVEWKRNSDGLGIKSVCRRALRPVFDMVINTRRVCR